VAEVFVEIISDEDMTYRMYKTTESLDLEALSEAQTARKGLPDGE
jgi:hypothetical protein